MEQQCYQNRKDIKMKESVLRKYARLAVEVGVNVQPNQTLVINAPTEAAEFARYCVEAAYQAKAGYVYVRWNNDAISKLSYQHANIDRLKRVDSWFVDQYQTFIDENACALSIYAPSPGLLADVDSSRVQQVQKELQQAIQFFREYMMANKAQWSLVSVPTAAWAAKIYPDKTQEDAIEALWEAILEAVRVSEDNDPVTLWEKHNQTLHRINKQLNDYQFDHLHFTNSLGTDLKVGLVKNHRWAGGQEKAQNGAVFNPNIPTEETFTMPDRLRVNGSVRATKPLNYQGRLIEDFTLTFKDGKVVEFDAKKERETLETLLNTDEGSRYLGEVALISHDSPISNTNILFYNTLFDENASCHLALGRAYPMNVEGGLEMDEEQLKAAGMNFSMNHEDFMFGSADMRIVGVTQAQEEIVIFDQGNFVI